MLNNYNFFKDEIGREKQFKTQKALWEWIAAEMPKALNSNKTGYQIGQHIQNLNKKNAGKEKINKVQQESVSTVIGSVINVEQTSIISAPVVNLIDIQEQNDAQSVHSKVDEICEIEEPRLITVSTPLLSGVNSQNKELTQNGGPSKNPVSAQLNFGFSQYNGIARLGAPPRACNIGVATVYGMPSNRVMPVHGTNTIVLPTTSAEPVRLGCSLNSAASGSAPIQLPTTLNFRSISSNVGTVSSAIASTSGTYENLQIN